MVIINTITISPSFPPQPSTWAPSPSPSPSSAAAATAAVTPQHQEKQTINFSPPLIAMVVVIAFAFLLITYSRLITRHLLLTRRRITRWRNRNRQFLPSTSGDESFYDSPFNTTDGFHPYSPYGLDESFIKAIPLTLYNCKHDDTVFDCSVCLVEFENDDYIRTLPVCSHAFHVECIDMWLRSHATCPLCRSHVVVKQESPFVPIMCSRIRPSLDEYDIVNVNVNVNVFDAASASSEITQINEVEEERTTLSMRESNCTYNSNNVLLMKRSYSFGFERKLGSERMVMEPTTASPWRYNRRSFWSKRTSPFGLLGKPRVFSFRGMKSPFFRRRGFLPLSEGGGAAFSSRRRRTVGGNYPAGGFSSSRMRCGDPEALLSPERYNR